MHVAQANLLPVPERLTHAGVLDAWPSLVDIAEIAAGGGTRVTVVQASSRTDRITRNGIDYHFVEVARLAALLSWLGADLLHVHGLAFAGHAFDVSRQLPRLPILCQDHADRLPHWWQRARWKRWYSAVAAVSFTAAEQARPFVDAGILGKHAQVFAIPECSSRFTPGDRDRARERTGLRGDPCVLWVGHLAPGKDPLTVIDGVAQAALHLPRLEMWCAFGTSPLLAAVRERILAWPQLAGRVHLLGKVPHDEVQALMRATDLFVSGSHAEGCGYALMEALACGAVPVVTDIPPFRALTGDGTVGHLWPPGDARRLAGALVDAGSHGTSPARVRRHFESTLSFDALGRRWAGAYAQVVEGHRRQVGR